MPVSQGSDTSGLTTSQPTLRPSARRSRHADWLIATTSRTLREIPHTIALVDEHESVGTGLGAAGSSFCFFACGALIPVLPYIFGLDKIAAAIVAALLGGMALLMTGALVGLLSGGPPLERALRQLAIGIGAAAATYLLGLLIGGG